VKFFRRKNMERERIANAQEGEKSRSHEEGKNRLEEKTTTFTKTEGGIQKDALSVGY